MTRSRLVLLRAWAAFAVAGCAAAGSGSAMRAAHAGRAFERAIIPSMTVVHGVAANDRYLFVASPSALGVLDRRFNEWLPPFSRVEGWPGGTIDMMLADPLDQDAAWFVSGTQVYRYRVGFDNLTRTIIPAPASAPGSVFIDGGDPAGGLIIRVAQNGAYVRVSPTGVVQPIDGRRFEPRVIGRDAQGRPVYAPAAARYAPESAAQIIERYPAIRGFERLLTQDASLRTWPVLSAASHSASSQVWFGTRGGGVFRIDPLFTRGDQMAYGLLADGGGAVALAADGIWIGGAGLSSSARAGLTFTDHAMRTWQWVDGGMSAPFAGARITGLSVFGSLLWASTTRGVVLVSGRGGDVVGRWSAMNGLPGDAALSVEATRTGAWVGTSRGLVFITSDGQRQSGDQAAAVGGVVLAGRMINGLTRRGDTLWIASDAGALVLPPGTSEPRRLRAATTDSRLVAGVTAIATADSVVVIATEQGHVLRVAASTGDVLDPVTLTNATRLGRVNAVAVDARTVWVGGTGGVIIVERATGRERFLGAGDIPGDALSIALTPAAAWIGTRDAVVWLERLSDGMVR